MPASIVRGSVAIGGPSAWLLGHDIAGAARKTAAGEHEYKSAGLEIRWDPRRAAHAAANGCLCLVWGDPRAADAGASGIASRTTAGALLARIAQGGVPELARIRGAFGLLFLDARAQRAILAVDRFSVETLCYGVEDQRLAFSDRADRVPLGARTLSRQALGDYAHFHCVPAPATCFDQVRRLPGGSHVVAERGRLDAASHWAPRFGATDGASLGARAETFRTLIRGAIAQEAERGVPLGCFLSGGTDSSTIAGMLGLVTGRAARTYSIGFDEPGYDEMEYARIAARHFATDHHEHYVTPDELVRAIPDVAASFDQPFGNSSVVPAYFCARMARADGVARLLGGDGGDELFGGNSRYRMQKFLDLYQHVPRSLRERLLEPLAAWRGAASVPGLRHAAGYVRHARVPMPDRMETFNLLRRIGAERVFAADVLAAVDLDAPLAARRATYAACSADDVVDRMLQYDWKYTLADSDLPKVREATRLAGIEVAFPFLADEIADFSLGLPAAYKLRRFKLRWFFKEALRGFLPAAIIAKKKHGFGLPFGPWAVRHAGLRGLVGDSLAGLERRGILRPRFRDELLRDLLPQHPGYYGELAWILMMLEQWLAAHPDAAWTRAPAASKDRAA